MDELTTRARRRLADVLAFGLAAYAIYWVVGIVDPQIYRVTFLLVALVLTFLVFPLGRLKAAPTTEETGGLKAAPTTEETGGLKAAPTTEETGRLKAALAIEGADTHSYVGAGFSRPAMVVDALLIAVSIAVLAWPVVDFGQFIFRAATPTTTDVVLGSAAILVVLEATRRTSGWVLPATAVAFLAYGYFGPLLDRIGLSLVAHRGYSIERLVGTLYMTLEGIFGVPLDVTTTYIILFTIYGAVLEHSGAGQFFVNWTMAAIGRSGHGSGPGRTVTLAGYLLGSVSGSGVANTVMLGSICWPMMRRAGYPADVGGAILAAAGIGALLAPPAMGAAAFLIAEYLQITYFEVIAMAAIPAGLYYLSIFLMVEGDSRRLQLRAIDLDMPTLAETTRRGWHHFASLIAVVALLARGFTAFRAVFWATALAVGLSFLDRQAALMPRRLAAALAAGARGVLPVAATTATAGIIVGVITLTGLGLKVAGVIVTLGGGSLVLTTIYAALAVWALGLAVPVTASYIIAAVMVVPALVQLGVSERAAHMFVFYYAVLSEVSPPTALSPFAAAAVTGGNPLRTTMLSWKYTAPAFIVPFLFTLDPRGMGLLLQAPLADVLWTAATAMVGVMAVAAGVSGWMRRAATPLERALALVAAVLLFVPHGTTAIAGLSLLAITLAVHWRRTRVHAPAHD